MPLLQENTVHFITIIVRPIIASKIKQGSYMSGRVKFMDFLRTFKAMYQQIQGLNTEEKALEILGFSKM
jgi:hypothetical protein